MGIRAKPLVQFELSLEKVAAFFQGAEIKEPQIDRLFRSPAGPAVVSQG